VPTGRFFPGPNFQDPRTIQRIEQVLQSHDPQAAYRNGNGKSQRLLRDTKDRLARENKRLPGDVLPRPELEVHDGDVLVTRKNTYDLVAACALVLTPHNDCCCQIPFFGFV
jgi:hypothetical protein